MYAGLVREPFNLSIEQIGKLTDRQITDIYFRPKPEDLEAVPEPKTEDDIRRWCVEVAAWQGMPPDQSSEWIEKQVQKWRAERG